MMLVMHRDAIFEMGRKIWGRSEAENERKEEEEELILYCSTHTQYVGVPGICMNMERGKKEIKCQKF